MSCPKPFSLSPPSVMTNVQLVFPLLLFLLMPMMISSQNEGQSVPGRGGGRGGGGRSSDDDTSGPFSFGTDGENVTVQVGTTAYLHCPVINLGDKSLSWVRRQDWHILTHGVTTFTSDLRFQLVHDSETEDWMLQIKYAVARDSGIYECQVNTKDGILSHRVELKVVTPEAFILADEEYHIDHGSSLSLVCIIEKATVAPQYVFWYHDNRMVNFDSERGISVTTSPGRKTHSQLFIKRALVSDSGNYTCAPSNSLPASITVFVSGSEVKPWTSGQSSLHLQNQGLLLLLLVVPLLLALFADGLAASASASAHPCPASARCGR